MLRLLQNIPAEKRTTNADLTRITEREGEKIIYGIRKSLHSFSPIWGNLHYYADLWHASAAAKGLRAKLGVWLAPPGGWTDDPIEHFEPRGFERFTTHTPGALRRYVAFQYAGVVFLISHFLAIANTADMGLLTVYALCITVSTVALGAVLERFVWGKALEIVRTLAFAVAFWALPDWVGYVAPLALKVAIAVIGVASALWLLRQDVKAIQVQGAAI